MVLSIVRCSYYQKGSELLSLKNKESLSDEVELIGPIVGPDISSMRNFGASQASGEWILFVDHDCDYCEIKVLETLKQIKKNSNNLGAFSGVYKQQTSSLIQKTYDRIQRLWVLKGLEQKAQKLLRPANHLLGGCLVVKKEAWEKVGGFDEKIGWGGEETEFVQRLQKNGYLTGVTYSLRVLHRCNIGFFGLVKRAWVQNYNRGFYKIKLFKKPENYKPNKIVVFNFELSHPMILSVFGSISLLGFWSGTLIALLKS